jgi:FtsP/CotA-like multicopper oxidase with cupredoxin domain
MASPIRSVSPGRSFSRPLRVHLFLVSLGALLTGAFEIPYRFMEDTLVGLAFTFAAVLGLGYLVASIVRPSRRLYRMAFWVTAGLCALWTLALTIGLPFGPFAGRVEPFSFADVLAITLGIIALPLLALLTWQPLPIKRRRLRWTALGSVPTVFLVALVTFVGVGAALNPLPYAVNMGMSADMPMQNMVSVRSLVQAPGNEPVKTFTLTAEETVIGGKKLWTYNNMLPGPELRVTQGDRVIVTLINHLPASTTIHWHGIRLPNAEDGVAGVTQDAVTPGKSYTYNFVVPDAGTFWYHSHQDTYTQLPRGLYGALVALPKNGFSQHYAHDYSIVIGDAFPVGQGSPTIVVNGHSGDYHLDAQPGDLVRLRIINAEQTDMTGAPEPVTLLGTPYKVVALDGNDLNQPQEIGPELIPLGVGQRADLEFRMPSSAQVKLIDERLPLGSEVARTETVSIGNGAAPSVPDRGSLKIFDLTSYGVPAADPLMDRNNFDVTKVLYIQEAGFLRYGRVQKVHLINGKYSPYTDPLVVYPGQVVRLRFINDTDESHPMHLHGHFFTILSKNGKRLTGSPVHLDSILVGPHETWEVAFVANNPGLWMLHCHVLVHAAYGLSMMIIIGNVTTPYEIGTRSGNFPE